MFSFRRDKTGFFATLILLAIVTATVVSTLVLLVLGVAQGDWKAYLLGVKWVLGSAWVLCIFTVLVRVTIFRWQMIRRERAEAEHPEEAPSHEGAAKGDDGSQPH
jgi:hypothetical protein